MAVQGAGPAALQPQQEGPLLALASAVAIAPVAQVPLLPVAPRLRAEPRLPAAVQAPCQQQQVEHQQPLPQPPQAAAHRPLLLLSLLPSPRPWLLSPHP